MRRLKSGSMPRGLAAFIALSLTTGTGALAAEPLFTAAQAAAGEEVYKAACGMCHGTTLMNGQFGTPLRGPYFRNKWNGASLAALLQFTLASMPPEAKEREALTREQVAAALAYILSRNKLEPGARPLPVEPAQAVKLMLEF